MHLINPSLAELQFLVGDWKLELSNAEFLPDPGKKVEGKVSFDVVDNGAFLVMRQAGAAIWLISRDQDQAKYQVFYFDDRRVSRVYVMSFQQNIWKMWRQSRGFSQRFEANVTSDKKSIEAHWEKTVDGEDWVHDFDMLFTRLSMVP